MNKRFLTVLGLAAVLALAVSAIFYQITSSVGRPRRSKTETKEVVVTTVPVPLGVAIQSGDLKIVSWPADNIPPGAFHKIDEVVDRVTMSNLLVDEPVLAGRLAVKGSGLGLSPNIPSGMRAVSVRVNDVIAVAGFVLPGSHVDVLVSGVPRGPEGVAGPVTRTILSNIQVLSAGTNIQADAKGQAQNVAVVTLLVTPAQGEILTHAQGEGRIQLALRNNTDLASSAGSGVRSSDIFGGVARAAAPEPKLRPRPVTVRLAPPAPPPAPPKPAPPPQVEIIRGDKKSMELVPILNR